MKKIMDVYGYYANAEDMFEKEDSFYGSVLVDQDNTFEGVVQEYCGEEYSLVFGKVSKDKIDFVKVQRNDARVAHRLEAERENDKYYGYYSAKSIYIEIPIGECKVSTLPADKTREETEFERNLLQARIQVMSSDLGPLGQELYQDFINRKNQNVKEQPEIKK